MIWFLVAAGVCGGDLWIKKWIRDHKDLNSRQAVAGGHIVITKYFNDGAMLGALRHHARLLAGITVFLLGLVCGLLAAAAGRDDSWWCGKQCSRTADLRQGDGLFQNIHRMQAVRADYF